MSRLFDRYEFSSGGTTAIITNAFNGSFLTTLNGRKVILFGKHLSEDRISSEFLDYIMQERCNDSEAELYNFFVSASPEDLEILRVMFNLL